MAKCKITITNADSIDAPFCDKDGNPVIIESLVCRMFDGDEYVKVDNAADLDALHRAMGWAGTADFERETGVTAAELIGTFWLVVHNRVFTRGAA